MLPLVLSRIAGATITGGLAIYVARTHGAEFSGQFFFFVSTVTILSVLTRLGVDPYLSSTVAPSASQGTHVTTKYLVAAAVAVSLLTLVAGVVLVLLHLAVRDWTDGLLEGLSAGHLILAVFGLNSVWIVGAYSRAVGRAGTSIFIETGLFSLWLFATLELGKQTGYKPTPGNVALACALLCPLLMGAMIPLFVRTRGHWYEGGGVRSALTGVLRFGAVTVTNGIVILIPLQVLGWYGLAEEAGVYNAALRVSMLVGAFGVVIKSVVVRQATHARPPETDRLKDVRQMGMTALPWIAISLGVASQGSLLVKLFGPEFSQLKSIIPVMLIAQCVYVAGNLIETKAVLKGEAALLNITSLTTLVVAVGVTPILVNTFGLRGAAWGFAVTIVVSRIQLVWLYLRGDGQRRVPLSTAGPGFVCDDGDSDR